MYVAGDPHTVRVEATLEAHSVVGINLDLLKKPSEIADQVRWGDFFAKNITASMMRCDSSEYFRHSKKYSIEPRNPKYRTDSKAALMISKDAFVIRIVKERRIKPANVCTERLETARTLASAITRVRVLSSVPTLKSATLSGRVFELLHDDRTYLRSLASSLHRLLTG